MSKLGSKLGDFVVSLVSKKVAVTAAAVAFVQTLPLDVSQALVDARKGA